MNCEPLQELLSAYLDDEVNLEERQKVELHLSECTACKEALRDLKGTKFLLNGLARLTPSPIVWEKISQKIPQPIRVPFYRQVTRGLMAAVAIIVVLLGSITLLGFLTPESTTNTESNVYLGNHAYHVMRQPLADHASWSFIAGESDFELAAPEE